MSIRTAAAWILTAFALVSIAFMAGKAALPSRHSAGGLPTAKVIVYYFHGDVGCGSCDRIEAYGREAVLTGFATQIQDGTVQWRSVNTDRAPNEHFVNDYELLTRSIVVADARSRKVPKWKNLDRVWELLDDKAAFERYVQDEVGAYVGAPR